KMRAMSADWSSHTATVRIPDTDGAMRWRRCQMTKPSATAPARIPSHSSHTGHWPIRTNEPFSKTVDGYLNKNSNICFSGFRPGDDVSGGHAAARIVAQEYHGHSGINGSLHRQHN